MTSTGRQGTAFRALLVALILVLLRGASGNQDKGGQGSSTLRIVVMDPLSDRLACDCVAGYARRRYDKLGGFVGKRLGRPVAIAYAESLSAPQARAQQGIDIVIGKFSEVVFDARKIRLEVRPLAMLTDKTGAVTQKGLFVVRQADKAKSVGDLKAYRLLLGPEEATEKRAAAVAALEAFGLPVPQKIPESPSCSTAALAVAEKDADAAVISSYAMPLLEGCGTIDKGTLRIVGETDPVPFTCVFLTARVSAEEAERIARALLGANRDSALLAALESRDGFVRIGPPGRSAGDTEGWPDWRGRHRAGISSDVPERLPNVKRLLWSRTLTGEGVAGLAVHGGRVVVADKDLEERDDIFRCLDSDTGEQVWKLRYAAAGEMEFTNTPRANPVIHGDLVYVQGAFGHLHCLKLESGALVWRKNILEEFGAKLPKWGTCSTPLIVGEKLIVNPGAGDASIVALDARSGKVVWSAPGDPPGYSSFLLAEFSGVRQIVGYDAISLGGWDPETGKRLWRLLPDVEGDYNVPTPIAIGERLLVATENNGARLYAFDPGGRIKETPIATNRDLAPDTATPVVLDGMVFGSSERLLCLDCEGGLKTLWEEEDEETLVEYCTFIAGNGRILVLTREGVLWLLKASRGGFCAIARLDLFDDVPRAERDVWSHPALVGNRLYVRNQLGVYCFLL